MDASVSRTWRPGCAATSAAMARGTSTAAADGNAPIVSRPASRSRRPASSCVAAATSSRTLPAWRTSASPATVVRTPRACRSKSAAPAAFSVTATCRDTADCVYPRRSAAALNDPERATSRTTRRPVSVRSGTATGYQAMRIAHG
ncbi:hypothetical protein BJF90_05110 [Pseudonocardia sp. CNS-004]|nr:hypothetical protein BJF90_05110 [Pseudonocardia sp. CNS-004]